jgi:ATP-dependent exoDNAse (exonuclease V) beta subunit
MIQASEITLHSSLISIHAFCRRVLRDHPFEAGVDPWFTILGTAGQRALADPLLYSLIEARRDDPIIRQLLEAMDLDELRDAVFSFYRRTRQSDVTIAHPNDPAPFLETLTRCYADMLALNESPDDSLGPLIRETKPDLAGALEWGARLAAGEFDWKAFRLLREFRGHFRSQAGNVETGRLIKAAREALTGFLDACLDRESARWSETLLSLTADLHEAYTSAKAEIGALDFDDLLSRTDDLFQRHQEIAARYPDKPHEQESLTVPHDLSRIFAGMDCEVEVAFLPEFYSAEERHLTQAEFIAQRIAELISAGIPAEDIGILIRSTYYAYFYERRLAEYGIDSCFTGSRPLSEAPGIPEIISLLGGIDDAHDLNSVLGKLADRCLAMPDGRRRFANARKLLDLSENLDLPEFLAQVQETEITQISEHGVRIMPIHKAGRMPVVFITDMSRSLDPKPDLLAFDPDRGLATWIVNPMSGKFAIPLAHQEIGDVIRDRQLSREWEILSTALTHARDRLILVGCSNLRGDQGLPYRRIYSWSGWIEKTLDLGPGTPDGQIGHRITLSTDPPRVMPVSRRDTLAVKYAAEFREGRPIPDVPPSAIAAEAVERCLAPHPPIAPVITRISVSQALDYIECPARYRLLHIIGVPEEGGEPPDDLEETEVSAADLGHHVHDLLSRLDFSQDIRPQVQGHPLLERFAESRWCGELQASDRMLKEVPFEVPLAGKVLAGRMDVLYHGSDGWVVLDYKTGRAETRERYELQVGIYAHVTHRLMSEMPAQAALVLLTIGEDWIQDTSDGSVAETAAGKLAEVCASIDSGLFGPIPSKACDWCSFKGICPT